MRKGPECNDRTDGCLTPLSSVLDLFGGCGNKEFAEQGRDLGNPERFLQAARFACDGVAGFK